MSAEERLLATLFNYEYIPPVPPPKRCRVCGGELDVKYGERHRGLLCLTCSREDSRQRAKEYYRKNPSKMAEYNKNRPKQIVNANATANFKHPIRQKCSVYGCERLGVRHHPDYSKPDEIVWLCPIHHYKEHHDLDFRGTLGF